MFSSKNHKSGLNESEGSLVRLKSSRSEPVSFSLVVNPEAERSFKPTFDEITKSSVNYYSLLHKRYAEYACATTNCDLLIEHNATNRPLRILMTGDVADLLKDKFIEQQNFHEVISDILKLNPNKAACASFNSKDECCFHFPYQVYSKKKYQKIGQELIANLSKYYNTLDIEEEVRLVGVDGAYPVVFAMDMERSEIDNKYCFDNWLGTDALELTQDNMFTPTFMNAIQSSSTNISDKSSVYSRTSSWVESASIPEKFDLKNKEELLVTNDRSFKPPLLNSWCFPIEDDMKATFLPSKAGSFEKSAEEFENVKNMMAESANRYNINVNLNESEKIESLYKTSSIVYSCHLDIGTNDVRGIAFQLVHLINKKRFWNESNRYEICAAIKHSYPEPKEAAFTWAYINDFFKYDKLNVQELYREMTEILPKYSVKTIAHYAQIDNYANYEMWHIKWISDLTLKMIKERLEVQISEWVYRMNWLNYIVIDRDWYMVSNHKSSLEKTSGNWIGQFLQQISNPDIFRWPILGFDNFLTLNEFKRLNTNDVAKRIHVEITALITKISSLQLRSSISGELLKNFQTSLDREPDDDPTKTAFINGVVVATDSGINIESAKLEDFIIKCTNCIIAPKKSEWDHALMEYMKDVFPEDLCESMLIDLAGLYRGKPEKKMRFMTGINNNSKSCILNLIRYTLGDYYHSVNIGAIKGIEGNAASPELASAKNCKIVTINDPDPNAVLGMDVIKALTGGDMIYVRKLHQNGGLMKATFRFYLACNAIPKLSNADVAGQDRILIYPFLARWVDDIDDPRYINEKYLRKKDPNFDDKLKLMAPAFARLLIEYYPKYIEDMVKCTRFKHKLIVEETNRQWENINIFLRIFNENFKKNPSGQFTLRTVMRVYNKAIDIRDRLNNNTWFSNQLSEMGIKSEIDPESKETIYFGWSQKSSEE